MSATANSTANATANPNVAHLLDVPLAQHRDAIAVIDDAREPKRVTFGQLDVMASTMHGRLCADGLTVGDHVIFFAPPSAQLYAALIAVWRAGAVATFVEPSAGQTVLNAACAMCKPRALIASPKAHLLRCVSAGLRAVPLKYAIDGWTPFTQSLRHGATIASCAVATVHADAPALLTFTSGSTGTPKGAIRTHGILRAQLRALTLAFAHHAKQCELVALPIVVLLNLANGVTTVLPNADLRKPGSINALPVLRQLREHGATSMVAAPAFLERLVAHPNAAQSFAHLDTVITGGGPVFPNLVARLAQFAPKANVISVYGSTEAEPIAHIAHREVSEVDWEQMKQGGGLLTGVPVNEVALRLVRATPTQITVSSADEFDALAVNQGEVGEIVVTGDHVVKGYWGGIGDRETKIRVADTIWHRTGDLGKLDSLGRLWLLGRLDASTHDARGAFYPFAVECAAHSIPGVRRAAAFANHGHRILVIESDNNVTLRLDPIREQLHWATLDDVRSLFAIPTDKRHNSKVNYAALREQLGLK